MTLFFALLAVQAVVGLAWAWKAFRVLFRLRARAVADDARAFPGLFATLRSFRGFLTRPDDRPYRLRLALLTFLLLGLSSGIAIMGAAG